MAHTVIFVGDTKVLGKVDYTFSFTTGSALTTGDYFVVQFPTDFFERFSDYSAITCAQCSEIRVFGISNMVYMKPSAPIGAAAVATFTITGLVNPAYAQSGTLVIIGFT